MPFVFQYENCLVFICDVLNLFWGPESVSLFLLHGHYETFETVNQPGRKLQLSQTQRNGEPLSQSHSRGKPYTFRIPALQQKQPLIPPGCG